MRAKLAPMSRPSEIGTALARCFPLTSRNACKDKNGSGGARFNGGL
ncbi:hypothetical protein HNQ99_002785 [Rhizorhapis suberifaciens]|uniref:Uncharacterized protein n=1 Tax=Rhizorhapis suberifaciens TaxID=13656 RepID=A0A840HYK0_9SPHN|nr:hypothetical protein [Rhizorhapis suberifaciens]